MDHDQSVMTATAPGSSETLPTRTKSWDEVANDAWERRRRGAKYPKNLTAREVLAQAATAFNDEVVETIGVNLDDTQVERVVPRGTGLLMRLTQLDSDKVNPVYQQFVRYIVKVSSNASASLGYTPWPSWKDAWRDFADYAGMNTTHHKTAMVREGIQA